MCIWTCCIKLANGNEPKLFRRLIKSYNIKNKHSYTLEFYYIRNWHPCRSSSHKYRFISLNFTYIHFSQNFACHPLSTTVKHHDDQRLVIAVNWSNCTIRVVRKNYCPRQRNAMQLREVKWNFSYYSQGHLKDTLY